MTAINSYRKSQFCKILQRIFFFKTIESIIKFLAKFVKQLKIFNERKKKYVPVLNVKKIEIWVAKFI